MPRMVAKNLTDSMVSAAQTMTSRYDLFDAKTRGLGLRVGTHQYTVITDYRFHILILER